MRRSPFSNVGDLAFYDEKHLYRLRLRHYVNSPRFIDSKRRRNFRLGAVLAFIFGAGLLLVFRGPQQVVIQREDSLTVAGFIEQPVNTPALQTMVNLLPAYRVVQRPLDGRISYVYADPNVCDCLYVGSPQAYKAYKQIRQEQHLLHKQPNNLRPSNSA
jgi:hypothetical protein